MVDSTNSPTRVTGGLRWLDVLWLPFFLLPILFFPPWGELVTYDLDEGYNLVRASLLLDGHALYTDIWHDQPPLMTYLLAGLFAVTGKSVLAARLMVAAFGLLAAGSFYLVVRHLHGRIVAFTAVVLLTCSAFYIRLNISVMETIPSFAFAFAAMACCCRPRWKPGWTEAAGVLSALALQVKLNTAVFIPFTLALLLIPAAPP